MPRIHPQSYDATPSVQFCSRSFDRFKTFEGDQMYRVGGVAPTLLGRFVCPRLTVVYRVGAVGLILIHGFLHGHPFRSLVAMCCVPAVHCTSSLAMTNRVVAFARILIQRFPPYCLRCPASDVAASRRFIIHDRCPGVLPILTAMHRVAAVRCIEQGGRDAHQQLLPAGKSQPHGRR